MEHGGRRTSAIRRQGAPRRAIKREITMPTTTRAKTIGHLCSWAAVITFLVVLGAFSGLNAAGTVTWLFVVAMIAGYAYPKGEENQRICIMEEERRKQTKREMFGAPRGTFMGKCDLCDEKKTDAREREIDPSGVDNDAAAVFLMVCDACFGQLSDPGSTARRHLERKVLSGKSKDTSRG